MERQDYSAEVKKHRSRTVRLTFIVLGTGFVVLALVGVFLPVLPSTPFLLLAAACYARASTRFYNWLLNNQTFGPTILEWRQHRSLPYRTKLWAIFLVALTFGVSILFFVRPLLLQLILALVGVGLGVFLYRIPSRDRMVKISNGG